MLQLNNAGEGGLHAEMVQDRSFDALAYVNKFEAPRKTMPLDRQQLHQIDQQALDNAAVWTNRNKSAFDSPRQQSLKESTQR